MKKVIVLLLLLTVGAFADNISPSDTVTLVGRSILSEGSNAQPDSLRIITFFKGDAVCSTWYNATDPDCYSASEALVVYDIFSDIDGSGGDGNYCVEIGAYGGGEAIFTYWYRSFTIGSNIEDTVNAIIDTLQRFTKPTTDSIQSILDTLQNQDGWVATSANQTAMTDTINAIIDTLQNQDGWIAQEASLTAIKDTTNAIIDTLQNQDEWIAQETSVDNLEDTVFAIIDTLQNHDDWVGTQANQTAIKDTVNAIVDTVQNQSNWVAKEASVIDSLNKIIDSLYACLDTLQNQDNWIGTSANQTLIKDTTYAILDTLQLWDDNIAYLDEAISGIDDNPWNNANSDTASGMGAWLAAWLGAQGDTSDYATTDEVWYNIDTTNIDSSDIGDWMVNNLYGGTGSDTAAIKAMMNNNAWGYNFVLIDTGDGDPDYRDSTGGDDSLLTAGYLLAMNDPNGWFDPENDTLKKANVISMAVNVVNDTNINSAAITATKIASNAITSFKIADGAITAAKIADDAIDFATFAGTAPTAWWNEGKTGYSLATTGLNGVSQTSGGLMLAANGLDADTSFTQVQTAVNYYLDIKTSAVPARVWYNIDTTDVDTSDIGDWMIDNFSGSGVWSSDQRDTLLNPYRDSPFADTFKIKRFYVEDTLKVGVFRVDSDLLVGDDISVIDDIIFGGDATIAGSRIAVMPEGWTSSDSTDYQGAGADASPSAWDATDSGIVKAIVADSLKKTALVMSDTISTGDSTAVMPDGWNAEDTSAYQGTGGDYSPSEWDATDSGVVKGIRADTLTQMGLSTGGGTEVETLVVLCSADSTQIQGALPQVYTLDQSTGKVTTLTTDVNGKLITYLDTDDYFVRVTANNYVQTTDTITVASGGGTDTLWLSAFSPGAPSGDLCGVYNWVKDANDQPIQGVTISAEIPQSFWPIKYQGQAVIARHDTTTDSTGYWYLPIYPNTILLTVYGDSSSYYWISGYKGGELILRDKVTVPDSTTFKAVPDSD